MAKLKWKVLTKKRPGVTQGLPPGTEDLAWVTKHRYGNFLTAKQEWRSNLVRSANSVDGSQ